MNHVLGPHSSESRLAISTFQKLTCEAHRAQLRKPGVSSARKRQARSTLIDEIDRRPGGTVGLGRLHCRRQRLNVGHQLAPNTLHFCPFRCHWHRASAYGLATTNLSGDCFTNRTSRITCGGKPSRGSGWLGIVFLFPYLLVLSFPTGAEPILRARIEAPPFLMKVSLAPTPPMTTQ